MNTLKGLLLGSAGAAVLLTAGTVAQAADAPIAAKGREPVYRCDTAGFIEYPGSDVCFKIGGRAQAWMGGVSANDAGPEGINFMAITTNPTSNHDRFFMGALARINVDIRSASEWGLVRAFIEGEFMDGVSGNGAGAINSNTGGALGLRHAFVQVGNVTFGKTWSTFFAGAGPEMFGAAAAVVPPPGEMPLRVVTLRYTHNIGNGVSVSIALEDPARHNPTGGHIGLAVAPTSAPDIVANISARGSWGRFQLSGAVHENVYRNLTGAPFPGSGSTWGWAGQAALVLNVPNMGQDTVHVVAGYSDGATGYMATAFGTGGPRPSVGLNTTGGVDRIEGWFVTAGYRHFWSPTLRSTIAVNYTDADYDNILTAGFATAGGLIPINDSLQIWGNLIWSPVPQLDLGVEVLWGQMDFPSTLANGTAGNGNDNDIWGAHITARRTF